MIAETVLEFLRDELTEDLKSEINAATLKHITTMLFLGQSARLEKEEWPMEHRIRLAVDAALEIDREVERRLEAD